MKQTLFLLLALSAVLFAVCSNTAETTIAAASPASSPLAKEASPSKTVPVTQRANGDAMENSASRQSNFLITDSAIGPLKLGMTLAEAKKALPSARFKNVNLHGGVDMVSVVIGKAAMVNFTVALNKIDYIETFNSRCATKDGIHPGSLIVAVEKILGKTKVIYSGAENEGHEGIEFEHQPSGISFSTSEAGIFSEGSRETKRYKRNAKIEIVSIRK